MASPSKDEAYGYTEGASAIDIQNPIRTLKRVRCDSGYGEDGVGSMFDGPSHSVIPSSAPRMSPYEPGRSRVLRREEAKIVKADQVPEVADRAETDLLQSTTLTNLDPLSASRGVCYVLEGSG
ncbi:hypothetical protein QCA50_004625 [Cerrena zonata]|uniref:Uncharacterized protein n=1 Tax=Cerrena zonata TaxID=2478898 RepID=A0AAW0GMD9_9APHY